MELLIIISLIFSVFTFLLVFAILSFFYFKTKRTHLNELPELKSDKPALIGNEYEAEVFQNIKNFYNETDVVRRNTGKGADIIQSIKTTQKKNIGSIMYECKAGSKWDNNWLDKMKENFDFHNCDFGFLITRVFPGAQTGLHFYKISSKCYAILFNGDNEWLLKTIITVFRDYVFLKERQSNKNDLSLLEEKNSFVINWLSDSLPDYVENAASLRDKFNKAHSAIETKIQSSKKIMSELFALVDEKIKNDLDKYYEVQSRKNSKSK